MANGLGEYFGQQERAPAPAAPRGGSAPSGAAPLAPSSGVGEYFAQSGFGAAGSFGPMRTGAGPVKRFVRRNSPMANAMGDAGDTMDAAKSGVIGSAGAVASLGRQIAEIAITGGAGFLVGKALSPQKQQESAYSWTGAALAVFFGVWGLGAQALYVTYKK